MKSMVYNNTSPYHYNGSAYRTIKMAKLPAMQATAHIKHACRAQYVCHISLHTYSELLSVNFRITNIILWITINMSVGFLSKLHQLLDFCTLYCWIMCHYLAFITILEHFTL